MDGFVSKYHFIDRVRSVTAQEADRLITAGYGTDSDHNDKLDAVFAEMFPDGGDPVLQIIAAAEGRG